MTKRVGGTSESYTSGSLYTIPASTGEGSANTSKASFILKLEVDDPNNSASATYNYHVNLRDENAPAVVIDDNNGSDNMGSITIEDENGDGKIEAGEEVTVTADPNTGSDFIGWQDENGIVVSEDEEFTFTAGEDFSNLTALFNKTITSSFKDEATTSPLTYTIYNEAEVATVDGCDAGAVDVTIPETITRDGKSYIVYKIKDDYSNGAFLRTSSTLESVTISDKIIKIGKYAFSDCSKLTEIIWGNNLKEIGVRSFDSCRGLISLVLPNSLRVLNSASLVGCCNITNVALNDGLEVIGGGDGLAPNGMFMDTKITSLYIPSSVKSLDNNIVGGCTTIQTITVDANNPYYEDRGLNVIIGKSDSPNIDERNMLLSATATNSVNFIPEGVTSVGTGAFANNANLTSIIIPSNVTSIGANTFLYCINLKEVIIESKSIYDVADGTESYNAGNLMRYAKTIRVLKTIDDSTNTFLTNNYEKIDGSGEYEDYNIYTALEEIAQDGIIYGLRNSTLTADIIDIESTLSGEVIIPSSINYDSKIYSVTIIGEEAFGNNRNITSITIPDSIDTLEDGAFRSCSNLETVIFADTSKITEIPHLAFYLCSSLQNVTIPEKVTTIGSQAFKGCSSLTSITIPSSVTSLVQNNFQDCSSLIEINVDENNANYCDVDGVLYNKTQTEILKYPAKKTATTYDISESVTKINSFAFQYCSSLTSITIPSGVTEIGYGAFSGCSGLTSIVIPYSVTSIVNNAFSGCSGLTSIVIPSKVTEINPNVFQNCSNLTSITIPSSVTYIGSEAFSGCSGLTSITIPSSVTYIGNYTFLNCTNLKTVYCDSVEGYTSADSNSSSSSRLFDNADTVYVLASIIDGGASNLYLNDTTTFNIPSTTTNVNGQDYYVYTRK